jgi:hypothetical protein
VNVSLSSGPVWRLVVATVAPMWVEAVEASTPLRGVSLTAGPGGLVVAATGRLERLRAAWDLTEAAGTLVATSSAFDGIDLVVSVPGLTVAVPAEVLAEVAAGRDRRWWAARVDLRLG